MFLIKVCNLPVALNKPVMSLKIGKFKLLQYCLEVPTRDWDIKNLRHLGPVVLKNMASHILNLLKNSLSNISSFIKTSKRPRRSSY